MIITHYYMIFYRIYDTMLYVYYIFNCLLAEVNEIQRHGPKYEGGFIYMKQEKTPPHILLPTFQKHCNVRRSNALKYDLHKIV